MIPQIEPSICVFVLKSIDGSYENEVTFELCNRQRGLKHTEREPAMAAKRTTKKTTAKPPVLDTSTVVAEIGALQVELQNTLSNVTASVTGKIGEFQQVEAAVTEKQAELQDLYGIEQEAMSLEALRERRAQEQADWDKARQAEQERRDDEQEERDKRWAREEEEHTYMVSRRNKRADEDYAAVVANHRREEAIRQSELQREWAERENFLKEQETEFAELKAQAEGVEDRIKAEVKKAEAIVESRMKKQYEHEVVLLQKDSDAATKLHEAEVRNLNNTISSLSDQIEALQTALDAARRDAREVTVQALESASGRQVSAALSKAMESQGTSGKGK